MLEHFVRNRRGSITVMLTLILVAALSLNSSLIEMAKYNGMKQLYKEMSENAAFSLLSHYDRDLYENFGFLALEQDVGEEELTKYLQMNLAGLDSGLQLNRADILANVSKVNVEGLYPLSQKDVYVSQMMEFSAYRAPTSLLNNGLNIENMLNELKSKLSDALPILDMFQQLTNVIEAYVDTVICLWEYQEAVKELMDAALIYVDKLVAYDVSVERLNNFISSYDDEPEVDDGGWGAHREKGDDYESQLKALQDAAEENAAELQGCIVELDPVLENYGEKMEAYMTAYNELLGADMEAAFATVKEGMGAIKEEEMKQSAQNFLSMIEDNMNEGSGLLDDVEEIVDDIPGKMVENAREELKEDAAELSVPALDLPLLDIVEEVDPACSAMFVLINNAYHLVEAIWEMVEGLAGAIKTIINGVGAIMLISAKCPFDPDMNHSIRASGLIGSETVNLTPTVNPYEAEDTAAVQAKIADSEEIAERVGYDVEKLQPGENWDSSALEIAMENLQTAEKEFKTACGNLKSDILDPVGMLLSLIQLVGALRNFIQGIIELAVVIIGTTMDDFVKIIYQKLFATVYATEMFSNRVTDMGGDTRLNGSSFFGQSDYADAGNCFVQADAEYIFCGSRNEIVNQTGAFGSIMLLRMVCNITSVLTDKELMEVIAGFAKIPIVGWIVIVVLVFVKLILESWVDMVKMIYAKEDVDIFKLDGGYFALSDENLDELDELADKIIEEQIGIAAKKEEKQESSEENKKSMLEEYGEGLLKWGYKDHLFLLMLLFTPSDTVYTRSATLIEIQLQEKKAKDGAVSPFKLDEMATYIRVDTEAEYQPLLPIPIIPGLNDTGIKIRTVHYSGY